MSNLNDFYNNNSDDNSNNINKTDSINDLYNNSNQELEIEDTRNLVDAPDLTYNRKINDNSDVVNQEKQINDNFQERQGNDSSQERQINDNSNVINHNNLQNQKFEREYNFNETDNKTIIKNVFLITVVVIVGFFLVYNYSGVKRSSSQQETSPSDVPQEQTTPTENTPAEQTTPTESTPTGQDTPVVNEDGTINHQADEVYLEVSTSRIINGSGIEEIGTELFYKTDINREINSNGVNFVIKKVTKKGVTIILNTELYDSTSSAGCRKNLCTVGSEIYLDGKITEIFETLDKDNKIYYSFNVYNIKY